MKKLFVLLMFIFSVSSLISAQDLKTTWGFDGWVATIKPYGNYVYVGGNFKYYGPTTGHAALITKSETTPDMNFPIVNGVIKVCIPDGNGGWYIGGKFTKVGDSVRNYLAQINAGGTISDWNPDPNGEIERIAIGGDYVYVSGYFTSIGGQQRHYLAKLNKTDGSAVLGWDPEPNDIVFAIAPAGNYIYLGGRFNNIAGSHRPFLVKLKTSDGSLVTEWYPIPDNVVRTVAISGSNIYVGGDFTSFWGIGAWYYAARLNDTTGGVGGEHFWRPTPNNRVTKIVLDGGHIFLAGEFTQIGIDSVMPRQFLAEVGTDVGKTSLIWQPNPNNFIEDITASDNQLYVVGQFTEIGGKKINHVARIDESYGSPDESWIPNSNSTVYAIAFNGDKVLLGGGFSSVGGISIKNLARLNKDDFTLDKGWMPSPDGSVGSIAINKNNVYIAGYFTHIKNDNAINVAKLNKTDGSADANWFPYPNGSVNCIALQSDTLIAGGSFTNIGGADRDHIAMLNNSNGGALDWSPSISQGLELGDISTIAINGGYVYAAGRFYNQDRTTVLNYFRKISIKDGTEDQNWLPHPNGIVNSIHINKNNIFIGGDFTYIGGQQIKYLAKLDLASGAVYPNWDPEPDKRVAVVTSDNEYVYAGGDFENIGWKPIKYLARLSYKYGTVDENWNPVPETTTIFDVDISTIALSKEKIMVGGMFNYIAQNMVNNFVVLIDNSYYTRVPAAPANLNVIASDHMVLLRWRQNLESDVIKYNIYSSTDTTKGYNLISSVPAPDTLYLVKGLKNGTEYFFRVTAEDADGNESDASKTASTVPNLVAGGLIAYYPFTHGSAADSSGNGNNGIMHGVSPTTDRFGKDSSAFYFDGNSAYIDCGKDTSLNAKYGLTITGWIYLPENHSAPVVSKSGLSSGYSVYIENNQLEMSLDQTIVDSTSVPIKQWVFFAVTFLPGREEFYINGDFAKKQVMPFTKLDSSSYRLYIGFSDFESNIRKHFKGKIDNIRIYNRALASYEIEELRNAGGWQGIIPSRPRNLHCVSRDVTGTRINWSPNSETNITKYNIYSTIYLPDGFEYIGEKSTPDTSFFDYITDPAMLPHYYKVTAVSNDGRESNFSDTIVVQPPADLSAPTAVYPLGTTSLEDTLSTVPFMWEKTLYTDYYRLQVAKDAQFDSLSVDTLTATDTTILSVHLPLPLKPFYWKVRAENACRVGPWSTPVYVDWITSVKESAPIPKKYFLAQNYPNPFGDASQSVNSVTTIKFGIPALSKGERFVTLKVYDILGRKVATLVNAVKSPGFYSVNFNASELSSGIYFYRLQSGNFVITKKMILMK